MGFFDGLRRGRKHQQEQNLVPVEEVLKPSAKPTRERPNICLGCKKYNVVCPYGRDTYAIGCADFVEKGIQKVSTAGRLSCPGCRSTHVVGVYGSRYQCKDCGSVFS